MTDFSDYRQKLDAIQGIVNELFSTPLPAAAREALMNIDSICDVPLFGNDIPSEVIDRAVSVVGHRRPNDAMTLDYELRNMGAAQIIWDEARSRFHHPQGGGYFASLDPRIERPDHERR